MAEVADPVLRRKVLSLAPAAARADRRLAQGEAWVLDAARRHWGLFGTQESGDSLATERLRA